MALARSRFSNASGFSLVETVVAIGLMTAGLVTLAQLFAIATTNNTRARTGSFATMLAEQKMEQLRGLAWGFDTIGLPVSDTTTDTAAMAGPAGCPTSIAGSSSGKGLSPSPDRSLGGNIDGFVDYLDINGCPLGGGSTPVAGTVYIRRWSVEPLPTNPNNTLILQVLVTRFANRGAAESGTVARMPEEARVVSIKTRKAT
jgi:type II secretory pathway pseudopilin PulG